jgi:hypothetical protein
MKKIAKSFISSFSTDKVGFSARKLSAFAAVLVSVIITMKKIPEIAMIDALYAWLCFGLLCLGIVTIEQIINLKNTNTPPPPTSPTKVEDGSVGC